MLTCRVLAATVSCCDTPILSVPLLHVCTISVYVLLGPCCLFHFPCLAQGLRAGLGFKTIPVKCGHEGCYKGIGMVHEGSV